MTTKPPYAPSTAAYPSNIHGECKELHRVANSLSHLASCFYATGNELMAARLDDAAAVINAASRAISDHTSARCVADFKTAQEMSGTLLRAVLVGAQVAKTSSD